MYFEQLFELWTSGLPVFSHLNTWFYVLLGSLIGLIFGALPGLSSTMSLAVFLPLTFGMDAKQGIVFLICIYVTATFGGAISAILVNIPGTPSAIATGLDGYPMAQRGEAGRAIGIATLSSVLGGFFGLIMLMLCAPLVVMVARKFGSWEYALLALVGISMVSYVSKGNMIKGLLGGVLGLFIASIGQDPIMAYPRFTLGTADLVGGIHMVVVMIGLFGLSEVFIQLEKEDNLEIIQKIGKLFSSLGDVTSNILTVIRSSIIGTFVGAVPAAGPSIGSITSYGVAKRFSKKYKNFGKGEPEALVAAESANNAGVGGALIPMMTLGIPGDPMTAVLLGALMIHGLTPGPMLFEFSPDYVSSIYISYALGLVAILVGGFIGSNYIAKALLLPRYILLPLISVLCLVGSFALNNNLFDVGIVVVFGIIGYILHKVDIPIAAVVLGVVLGTMFEDNLRRALLLGKGSLLPFITRPVCLILIGVIILIIISAISQHRKSKQLDEMENTGSV